MVEQGHMRPEEEGKEDTEEDEDHGGADGSDDVEEVKGASGEERGVVELGRRVVE